MNSKPYFQRAALPLLMILLTTLACYCTWTPGEVCWDTYGEAGMSNDDPKLVECRAHVTAACGVYNGSDPYSARANADCLYAAAASMEQQALSAGGGSCANFRLTSPLDGMTNGTNTFYWDPYPGATGYRIQLLESGVLRATFNANSSQTSLNADVSTGAIGQGSMFLVRAQAFVGPNIACTNDTFILRGAPAGAPPGGGNNIVAPPITVPTEEPICNNNYVCEGARGEDPFNCPSDCAPK